MIPSGFGRICNEVATRLAQRGHQISGCSILWDGVMTEDWYAPQAHKYPFHITGLAGRDWTQYLFNIVGLANPDIVIVTQDFPYGVQAYYSLKIDWSRRKFCMITPIDGEPIFEEWLKTVDEIDATFVISEFGVEAMRKAGRKVYLCPPAVDHHVFHPASAEERKSLRAKAGLADEFVLVMAAMNQGRKDVPHTIEGWWEFAKDKPHARLHLDMDKVSPAGWNIPTLLRTMGIPEDRVSYKEDWVKKGLNALRDRFVVCDAHSVLAHREGFGLPLMESMACGIPAIAMDWCAGTEQCGNGQGFLVNRNESSRRHSTWGNAYDYDPSIPDFTQVLNTIHNNPVGAKAIAQRGYEWAKARTWDKTTDMVEEVLLKLKGESNALQSSCASVQSTRDGSQVMQIPHSEPAREVEGSPAH